MAWDASEVRVIHFLYHKSGWYILGMHFSHTAVCIVGVYHTIVGVSYERVLLASMDNNILLSYYIIIIIL